MEEVTRNIVLCDSSEDEEKSQPKAFGEDRKIKSKRKKRKRERNDLHQRVLRAKRVLDKKIKAEHAKSNRGRTSKKICSRLLPRPLLGIYRNGAAGKEIRRNEVKGSINDINNARLEANMFKLLNGYESETQNLVDEKVDDENDNFLFDAVTKGIPLKSQKVDQSSPILVKVDGKKRHSKKIVNENYVPLKNNYENDVTKKKINSERSCSPIERYQELCNTISENFKIDDITEDFGPDPLSVAKKKLRNFYAKSFRNQFLSDITKCGMPLNDFTSPTISTVTMPNFGESTGCLPNFQNSEYTIQSKQNIDHNEKDKRKKCSIVSDQILNFGEQNQFARVCSNNNFLFNVSLDKSSAIHKEIENNTEPRTKELNNTLGKYISTEEENYISQKVKTNAATFKETNDANRYNEFFSVHCNDDEIILNKKRISATSPCVIAEIELCDQICHKKSPKKQKNHAQSMFDDCGKRHLEKCNVKSQTKMKHYKHVPTILRRCNNIVYMDTTNSNLTLKSMQSDRESKELLFNRPKQNAQFTQTSLISGVLSEPSFSNSTSFLDNGNIQNVHKMRSDPNLNNAKWWIEEPCTSDPPGKPGNVDIFDGVFLKDKKINDSKISSEMHPQKTMIFTKKDPNIQHSLHLANRLQEVSLENDSCEIKHIHHEKLTRNHCNLHSYHQTKDNCCLNRSSQSFDHSNFNSQSGKVPAGYQDTNLQNLHGNSHRISNIPMPQKCMNHEDLLIKRILRHPKQETNQKLCHNAEKCVRLVVVDCETPDEPHCSQNFTNMIPNVDSRATQGHIHCQDEEVSNVGILNGVQNVRLLSMGESKPRMDLKLDDHCVGNAIFLDNGHQPIKYFAFENETEIERVPVYSKSSEARRNRRYPRETVQEVMVVPRCEQEKIVYLKPQSLSHNNTSMEGCSHHRKVILCQPEQSNVRIEKPMNLCEIQVSRKTGLMGRNNEQIVYDLTNVENVQKLRQAGVNWKNI